MSFEEEEKVSFESSYQASGEFSEEQTRAIMWLGYFVGFKFKLIWFISLQVLLGPKKHPKRKPCTTCPNLQSPSHPLAWIWGQSISKVLPALDPCRSLGSARVDRVVKVVVPPQPFQVVANQPPKPRGSPNQRVWRRSLDPKFKLLEQSSLIWRLCKTGSLSHLCY